MRKGRTIFTVSEVKREFQMNTKNHAAGGVPRISRILVAIDFSFHASNALEWARSFAEAFGAKLILLHVIDAIAEIGADIDGVMTGIDSFQLLRDEAHKCMGEFKVLMPSRPRRSNRL